MIGKKVTTTSSGSVTTYATPRMLQVLLHWYYRREPMSDVSFVNEQDELWIANLMRPVRSENSDELTAAGKLLGLWELTDAGRAWVQALLSMPPPHHKDRFQSENDE